ncbi:glycosyl hydrolase 108 family protein [Methylocapsa palsarum]|uniref:Lysozyme family protein n=1 Tax=Methylocapsa palsarum TaxID=1612308 RepID=A0A1I4BEI1_9HYPH|nr:glycosyl hydrolase 108 family protein [Methylocapsa palsarum]SFK67252.1 Lysozyme family protein [Methylocapsa palsarum]
MPVLRMFMPITKVNVAQRLVYGLATAETEDLAGEICDYASTKPLYEKWSETISKSTRGKSLGNLRAMHGPVAAGKVTAISFNDADKQIEICAKVVDDAEWRKVEEGVYTGFSQGGAYAKRWTDADGLTRYTAEPTEISLVDLPCLPEAHFEMIKADGSVERRCFVKDAAATLLSQLSEEMKDVSASGDAEQTALTTARKLRDIIERASAMLQTMLSEDSPEKKRDEDGSESIYRDRYWAQIDGDRLRAGEDLAAFDFAVNSGPTRSKAALSRAVLRGADSEEAAHAICRERLSFMHAISKGGGWKVFGRGWGRRVSACEALAVHMIHGAAAGPILGVKARRAAGKSRKAKIKAALSGGAGTIGGVHPVVGGNFWLNSLLASCVVAAVIAFWFISWRHSQRALAFMAEAAIVPSPQVNQQAATTSSSDMRVEQHDLQF